MKPTIVKLDLQRIAQYVVKQGFVAVIDGNSVVILTATSPQIVDGVPYVSFRVDRIATMTAARSLLRRGVTRRLELQAA